VAACAVEYNQADAAQDNQSDQQRPINMEPL
jgi:hypothetical protein